MEEGPGMAPKRFYIGRTVGRYGSGGGAGGAGREGSRRRNGRGS